MSRLSNNTALNYLALATGSSLPAQVTKKSITFADAAGQGQVGAVAIATVTGAVEMMIIPYCTVNLVSAGGGTLVLGTAATTNVFIASTTATDIDAGEFWLSNAPAAAVDISTVKKWTVAANVIATVGTGTITAGTIDFYIHWRPISADGNVA